MDDAFTATVVADGVGFDARDAALLRAVDEHGSLHAASDELGRSYARAHGRIEDLEAAFGPLVDRRRGGSDGGGSRLTAGARRLLARFDRLQAAFAGTAAAAETVLEGRVRSREGELLDVETDAGVLRALGGTALEGSIREATGRVEAIREATEQVDAVRDGTAREDPERDDEGTATEPSGDVQVAVRADSVTLHAPTDAPGADATSARNRVLGTVEGIVRRETVAEVAVDVGVDRPLLALVTLDSVDRLDLEVGTSIVATWKATATRAVGHTPV